MWVMFQESEPKRERVRERDCVLCRPRGLSMSSKRASSYTRGQEPESEEVKRTDTRVDPSLAWAFMGLPSGVGTQQSDTPLLPGPRNNEYASFYAQVGKNITQAREVWIANS